MVLFMVLGAVVAFIVVFYMFFQSTIQQQKHTHHMIREKQYYSMDEVRKHSTDGDLWIVVRYGSEARVYDITEYADMHPGGDVIFNSGGSDATEKFNGPQHPPTVHDLIDEYWIGWVGQPPESVDLTRAKEE
ncbi:hypothetical protein M9434_005267 [Picochlorum sp. BPE23]|nr:hypothetical protein M9434_005267 [Picochlorum sp. BPE23]